MELVEVWGEECLGIAGLLQARCDAIAVTKTTAKFCRSYTLAYLESQIFVMSSCKHMFNIKTQ